MAETYRLKVLVDQKKESVTTLPDGRFLVLVKAKREEGKANMRVVTLMAEHLGVHESSVAIVRGTTTPTKTVIVRTGRKA